jgi:hypothetical protein
MIHSYVLVIVQIELEEPSCVYYWTLGAILIRRFGDRVYLYEIQAVVDSTRRFESRTSQIR